MFTICCKIEFDKFATLISNLIFLSVGILLGFVTSLGQQDEVRRDSLHGVEKVKIVNCKNPSFVLSLLFPSQLRSYKCTPFSHELQELRDLELQRKLFEKRYSRA